MKKIKSPWYGVVWVLLWTAALLWFLTSEMFTFRECVGLVLVWIIFVGITVFLIVQNLRAQHAAPRKRPAAAPAAPALNAPCPCGSGKKYKRCCGASETSGTTG
jgi:uncharacterized protein YecA (UPF0149 family)